MNKQYSLLLLSILALASCGGDGDSSSNKILSGLDGKWISNCYLEGDEDITSSHAIDEFTFSGSTFETSYKTWNNNTCSGTPNFSDSAYGTYSAGNTMTTISGLDAVEVDFKLIYQGREFIVKDIIRLEGDEFNFGVFIDLDTRPTELDFNILLTRQ